MEPNFPTATHTKPSPNGGKLLTKAEVAEFLGVTPRTIENLTRRGLPFYRIGNRRNRFDPVSVRAWLDRHCRVVRVGGEE